MTESCDKLATQLVTLALSGMSYKTHSRVIERESNSLRSLFREYVENKISLGGRQMMIAWELWINHLLVKQDT